MSAPEIVTVTIDGEQIRVPKGTNIIEAAKKLGVEIPHYCYHPSLSIAGNCRMCQVQVQGAPKLTIACNLTASEGLVVNTQRTSKEVEEAQRATLEFLLINHPLDCTVCDQAGHCKLQDYYYEYNSRPSRFIEDKVNKVKAEPLGPEIVYDGERCIVCTRCVRFCDEVTNTSELGVYNRGDRSVIGIHGDREIDNPLSGSVVDLCPVGALTHKRWRFNTRIWYTNSVDSVCTGCSTGCSAKIAVRDGKAVHVKARFNPSVNKEWMCDEGRYGFDRFQPGTRLSSPMIRSGEHVQQAQEKQALDAAVKLSGSAADDAAVFLSPFLTLEEVWLATVFAEKVMGVTAASGKISMQLHLRQLTETEKVLISPDYAPNARAANLFQIGSAGADWRESLQAGYQALLIKLRKGELKRVLLVGDQAIRSEDVDSAVERALQQCSASVAITPRGAGQHGQRSGLIESCLVSLPGRTVNEKRGVFVNRDQRFQKLGQLFDGPFGSLADWLWLAKIARAAGKPILAEQVITERDLFRTMTKEYSKLHTLSAVKMGELGITLGELEEGAATGSGAQAVV